ncbi:MAG: replication initiator protein [Microviridae sp.]|nr:MAG: replication initiator protein [Microviridae sp.]
MECLNPKGIVNPKLGVSMRVRCGKCLACKEYRAGQWTIRLIEQEKCTKNNWFVTLTLNDENITWGKYNPTLNKRDVQLFFKKLRKLLETRISYFAVGEYGSQTKRPHYHILLFNTGVDNKEVLLSLLQLAWTDSKSDGKGFIHTGSVTPQSIRYVSGYMEKGINGEAVSEEIQREFNLMSKGIGKEYLEKNFFYHFENEKITYRYKGIEKPLPRYYRDKIFQPNDRERIFQKIADSKPKRTASQEKDDIRSRIQRIRAKKQLKTERK